MKRTEIQFATKDADIPFSTLKEGDKFILPNDVGPDFVCAKISDVELEGHTRSAVNLESGVLHVVKPEELIYPVHAVIKIFR